MIYFRAAMFPDAPQDLGERVEYFQKKVKTLEAMLDKRWNHPWSSVESLAAHLHEVKKYARQLELKRGVVYDEESA